MTEKEFYALLDRYRRGTCSTGEKKAVETFLQKNLDKPSKVASWDQKQREKVAHRLKGRVMAKVRLSNKRERKERSRWVAVAASIVLLAVVGYLFTVNQEEVNIIPWSHKTTLNGQKLTFRLSDGSSVQLNAGSTLSFPNQFGTEREVHLSGEAFFEVAENASKPFIVYSGKLQTKVVGTSFNVEAYSEEKIIRVTIASGKVQVGKKGLVNTAPILTKGQQVHYDAERDSLAVKQVELAGYLNWKDGIIEFKDEPLTVAFKRLERWYGVKIEADSAILRNCFITSTYQDESLENILTSMSFINGISYKFLSNEKVKITGTTCNN